ncbi:MarR family winged helix-turn-helix transcriptional regulator [Allosphingosinicella deserti]|uniref:MarR family transcriptional regulator n=1 Tax=Allosphingosinicella deserti TaxID=2116704 RepID=A0A2P7QRD4_9SPHN|nr:MarR family winged helix-turn-helix transcriptional regulator [Sphingomonas deserti]PSJ40533.1 MarR family transcriptional regulator [Sphingomonas deserti]
MTAIFDSISEPLSRRVTAGLAKIGLVLRSRAWKGAGLAGVTPTQGQALALLREAPQGMKLAALAHLLGVSAPTASETVSALVAKQLAEKTPGSDRRSLTLKLTQQGETIALRTADWPDFLGTAVETLDPSEQAAFLRALVKIIRALQENGDIPVQRMCVTCRHFRPYAHPGSPTPHHCAFVDAPFADRHLRLNCPEQEPAPAEQRDAAWTRFAAPAGA